jgi:hypothetical protein
MHPFHQLLNKPDKTMQDKILLSALVALSTREGYSSKTLEEIWDNLAAQEWIEIPASKA